MKTRTLRWLLVSLVAAACALALGEREFALGSSSARRHADGADADWPRRYIVHYAEGADTDYTTASLVASYGVSETHRYRHALRGAAFVVPDESALSHLRNDARVVGLAPNRSIRAAVRPGGQERALPSQVVPWGIERVGGMATSNEGDGVVVAVLDSGIDAAHPDLAPNMYPLLHKDCVGTDPLKDKNGHGSHVAGTIAAANNTIGVLGLGSRIKLVSVRVLDGAATGTDAELICAIDWVTEHADQIDVANMSLEHYGEEGLEDGIHVAIQNSVAAGVTYVAAAGNDGGAVSVPGRFGEVITVSAYWTEPSGDVGFPVWSSYGPEVDIAAPGVYVLSTFKNDRYKVLSGTSMACAHVSAAAALVLMNDPGASPSEVREAIIAAGENGYLGQNDTYDPEPLLDVSTF